MHQESNSVVVSRTLQQLNSEAANRMHQKSESVIVSQKFAKYDSALQIE